MTVRRDRSGRSGRRRGSQNPGTACGAASTAGGAGVGACTGPQETETTSAAAIAHPASKALKVRGRRIVDNGADRWVMAGKYQGFDGLIDHPARDARAVLRHFRPCSAQRYRFRSVAASSGVRFKLNGETKWPSRSI